MKPRNKRNDERENRVDENSICFAAEDLFHTGIMVSYPERHAADKANIRPVQPQ